MVAIVTSTTGVKPTEGMPDRLSQNMARTGAIAKLKALHAEAEETARLANLLGRSGYVGITLPILAILTMTLSVEVKPAPQVAWLVFVGAVAGAQLFAYRRAMQRPFEPSSLKEYAKDLSAILLFSGFAWGAGAFLALPQGLPVTAAIAFAALPSGLVAYFLRDRRALTAFLAPVAALTAAACLLKPYAEGWTAAAAVVAVCAGILVAEHLYERLAGIPSKPAMLSLP